MAHAQKQIEANLNIVIIISFLGFYSIPRFPRTPTQKKANVQKTFSRYYWKLDSIGPMHRLTIQTPKQNGFI
jgi:hypothetical protein